MTRRLIDYDDLVICDMCEDYICEFHDKHFADCDCELEMWEEMSAKLDSVPIT